MRKAQPAEDPHGAGLRETTTRQTMVQAGDRPLRKRPDDRSVVPVQSDAGRIAGALVVSLRRLGVPALLTRVIGQQWRRSSAPVTTAASSTRTAIVHVLFVRPNATT